MVIARTRTKIEIVGRREAIGLVHGAQRPHAGCALRGIACAQPCFDRAQALVDAGMRTGELEVEQGLHHHNFLTALT